jgi:hypothetical protein
LRSFPHFWPEVREGTQWEAPAISECVAGCTNPFRRDNRMGNRVLAVREARFKLMLHFNPVQEQLYDLESDPGERSPLPAGAEKAVRRRLLEFAREHLERSTANRDVKARLRSRLRDIQLEWTTAVDEKQGVAS